MCRPIIRFSFLLIFVLSSVAGEEGQTIDAAEPKEQTKPSVSERVEEARESAIARANVRANFDVTKDGVRNLWVSFRGLDSVATLPREPFLSIIRNNGVGRWVAYFSLDPKKPNSLTVLLIERAEASGNQQS